MKEDTLDKILTKVPLNKILRPQLIDRIEINPKEIDELADNIDRQGLLQSPILRVSGDSYETVVGDRRILAIRQLGWTEVTCVICEMTDAATAEARASENLQRVDLSVIEEGRIYENLHTNYGMSIDRIARKMGKSPGVVKRRMDLLKMPQDLQSAMHKKQISYGVAEALWPISDATALDYYLGFAIEHGVTVPIARQWTHDWKSSQRRAEIENTDPADALTAPMMRPTYIACDLCDQPELVESLSILRICRNCLKGITGQGDT